MNTETLNQANFHNLPPEVLNMIFAQSDATALAKNRNVCAYWRNIIESLFTTQLEMTNQNWEAFVKLSTASRIHLKLTALQFPIYSAPEFNDFISRVNILEMTGYIPEYNVINILKACRRIQSLTIHRVSIDAHQGLRNIVTKDVNVNNDFEFDLTQLSVGEAANGDQLLHVTYYAAYLLKLNCLKELNLNVPLFHVENVLKLIFEGIFKPLPAGNSVFSMIWDYQSKSLELITFDFQHDNVPRPKPKMCIKFHPYEDAPESSTTTDSANQNPNILESCLFYFEPCEWNRQYTEMVLQIFQTQSKMKNLVICYRNEVDLERIQDIIETNCATLEEITIQSLEPMAQGQPLRVLSCSWFRTCLTLKELTLCSAIENRKVSLLDLLLLPTTLEKLSLTGFIPTGSSELFGGVDELPQYSKLTQVKLHVFPWFIVDGIPQTIFANFHFRWLLNLFPKIEKLTLTGVPLDRIISFWDSRTLFGVPNILESVSPEFVTWCRQGGGHNARIDSIQTSVHDVINPRIFHRITVHEILIRKD